MYIYIITAFTALIFINISLKTKNKTIKGIFAFLFLFLTCMIAALRDYSVGTDVLVYQKPYFDLALNYNNIFSYISEIGKNREQLYFILTWIFARFNGNLSSLFFVLEFLVVFPVYMSLNKIKKNDDDILLGMFIFYTFWYNQTFNIIRQSIAIAFALWSLTYLEENKRAKFWGLNIIAFLFHSSAIIMIPVYFLFCLMKTNMKVKFKILLIFFIIVLVILSIVYFQNIMFSIEELSGEGSLANKYSNYLKYHKNDRVNLYIQGVFWCTIFVIITFLFRNNLEDITNNKDFYMLSIILVFFGYFFVAQISYVDRILYYLKYPYIFIILSRLPSALKIKNNQRILKTYLLLYFSYYWIYNIVICNGNETIPYIFLK